MNIIWSTCISFSLVHKAIYSSSENAGFTYKKSIIRTSLSYNPFRCLANDCFVSEMIFGDTEDGNEPIFNIFLYSTEV